MFKLGEWLEARRMARRQAAFRRMARRQAAFRRGFEWAAFEMLYYGASPDTITAQTYPGDFFHSGTPSSRWFDRGAVEAVRRIGVRRDAKV